MYRYLNSQIDKTTNKMEVASAEFIDILQEPTVIGKSSCYFLHWNFK